MSNLMNILSQREISGFLPEKHVEEILSRRELINDCSIDKPYVQDGQVFTLKLENGLVMTISKDLINTLCEVISLKQIIQLECSYLLIQHSNDKNSFILKLKGRDEPITVSKQLVKTLSDMMDRPVMDPGPCFVRKLCTYLSNIIRRAFFGIF